MTLDIKPHYPPSTDPRNALSLEPAPLFSLIKTLGLRPHIEGGYFVETDRSPLRIPNPFLPAGTPGSSTPRDVPKEVQGTHALQLALESTSPTAPPPPQRIQIHQPASTTAAAPPSLREGYNLSSSTRSASTSILYLLTPSSPQGYFHRNKSRAIHSLISGRGQYVVVHPPSTASPGSPAETTRPGRVETFIVGKDVARGEKVQWVVEGGCWKASFLLPSHDLAFDGGQGEAEGRGRYRRDQGLLISETVVPGFEYEDHEFLSRDRATEVLGTSRGELEWLVRRD